jgi:hypothetical protein
MRWRRPGRTRAPRMARAVLTATLVAVAAGLGAGCSAPSPTASAPAPPAISWERVDPDPASREGPSRIVDAGGLLIGSGSSAPWVSEDGRAWSKGEVEGSTGATLASVAVGPGGAASFVGVGRVGGMGAERPVAFTSADGRRWTPITGQSAFDLLPGYEQAHLDLVASGPSGIVAAGTEWGTAGQRPLALVSTDGLRWERTAEPLVGSGPRALVATDAGFLLAGAANAPVGQGTHAAFWTSVDGRSWLSAPDVPAFAGAEPQGLAVTPGVIVAVGYRLVRLAGSELGGGFAPAVWVSTDGSSWMAAPGLAGLAWWPADRPTPAPGAMAGTLMSTVAGLGDGFVALGVRTGINPSAATAPDGKSRMTGQGVAWWSADGATWEMLPDYPALPLGTSEETIGAGMYSAVSREGLVIAVGETVADGVTVYIGTLGPRAAP